MLEAKAEDQDHSVEVFFKKKVFAQMFRNLQAILKKKVFAHKFATLVNLISQVL